LTFSIVSDEENAAYVNFCKFHTARLFDLIPWKSRRLEETDAELLELAIIELRERFQLLSREVVVVAVDLGNI
jgi:excinuclease ABC subunit C